MDELWKTAELIEMPFAGLTFVSSRNNVFDGGREPPSREGTILGLSDLLKSTGSLCCGALSKRDNPILINGTTAELLQSTVLLCSRLQSLSHYIVSGETFALAMRPFVKIL